MIRYYKILGDTVIALIVVLFFSSFGRTGSFLIGSVDTWHLMRDTLAGNKIWNNYYGIQPLQYWFSIRLLIFAIIFSAFFGLLLVVTRSRIESTWIKEGVEGISTIFESIPEPLYIVLFVILFLYLMNHYNVILPAFPYGDPSWKDTFIPAIALGLPGGLFLSRILSLQLEDEKYAQYVTTAQSKGASKHRIFYLHILENVLPMFLRQLPVLATLVLSSGFFAEYMFGYQGALYNLPIYGFGEAQKFRGLPQYQSGVILLLGILLVLLWSLIRIFTEILLGRYYPTSVEHVPFIKLRKLQMSWIVIGLAMITVIIFFSLEPHLLTTKSPSKEFLANLKTDQSAPFPPGNQGYIFGSDFLGRSILARTLQGTYDTLFPAIISTVAVLVTSIALSAMVSIRPHGFIDTIVRRIGSSLTGLPAFFILLLALHHRNLNFHYQEVVYILYIVGVELWRGTYVFLTAYDEWYNFSFVQGAISIGRHRITILFTHFRKWLILFGSEFFFAEFSRIISLMTMLAVFQVYAVEGMGWAEFADSGHKVIGSVQNTWFSMIGDATRNGKYMSWPYFLYASVIALFLIAVGSNLIAKGIRGKIEN